MSQKNLSFACPECNGIVACTAVIHPDEIELKFACQWCLVQWDAAGKPEEYVEDFWE